MKSPELILEERKQFEVAIDRLQRTKAKRDTSRSFNGTESDEITKKKARLETLLRELDM